MPSNEIPDLQRLKVIINTDKFNVKIDSWAPIKIAQEVNKLTKTGRRQLFNSLSNESISDLNDLLRKPISRSSVADRDLCIITYANNAEGWFDYFYNYYSKSVGCDAIYIVTPKPNDFKAYKIGGIISAQNLIYDDKTIASIFSDLSKTLKNYYKWTLVCDVDEIIMPLPENGKNLLDYVASLDDAISPVISLGMDVIQAADEGDFDFSLPISSSRKYAILNSAMCKPHLSNNEIKYSGGQHYCNYQCNFKSNSNGLVTLHLKYADVKTQLKVSEIVDTTIYKDPIIEAYAKQSIDGRMHPALKYCDFKKPINIESLETENFKKKYLQNIKYDVERGLYVGSHFVDKNLIEIPR